MIIEIHHYTLKAGQREALISFFEQVNRPALEAAGMDVFGPMRDLEDENRVHWMRRFESLAHREIVKDAFYDRPVWLRDVEPTVMPMIDHYEAELVETTAEFKSFTDS